MPGTNHEKDCAHSWTCQLYKQQILSYISVLATESCTVLNSFAKPHYIVTFYKNIWRLIQSESEAVATSHALR